ncbi:hypothetical protein A2U01_0067023, partial [Trifolium medium]|nr:hypothetical protein [Trifolium medium]
NWNWSLLLFFLFFFTPFTVLHTTEAESRNRWQPEVVVEETSMAAFARGLHRDYFRSANSRDAKCSFDIG